MDGRVLLRTHRTDPSVTSPNPSFAEQVEHVLDQLRPALRADGGNVELVSADEQSGCVELHFVGACSHCPASSYTLDFALATRLRRALPGVIDVVSV